MDKIFRLTKVTKFSDGDENFVQRKFCPTLFCPIRSFKNNLFQIQKTLVNVPIRAYNFKIKRIPSRFKHFYAEK